MLERDRDVVESGGEAPSTGSSAPDKLRITYPSPSLPDELRAATVQSDSTVTTGLAFHERCMWYDTGHGAMFLGAGEWIEPGVDGRGPDHETAFQDSSRRQGSHRVAPADNTGAGLSGRCSASPQQRLS